MGKGSMELGEKMDSTLNIVLFCCFLTQAQSATPAYGERDLAGTKGSHEQASQPRLLTAFIPLSLILFLIFFFYFFFPLTCC